MRDLIDDPHPEFTAAMMADLTGAGMPHETRQELTGGDFAVGRSSVHAGASEGAGGALARTIALMRVGIDPGQLTWAIREAGYGDAGAPVEVIYAAALRAMGTDPIPLAGTEAWEEPNVDYADRIVAGWWFGREMLDEIGDDIGLPRARLVPVQQEG